MEKYLLDTNTIIELFNDNRSINLDYIENLNDQDKLFASVLSFYELSYAKHKAPDHLKPQAQYRIDKAKSSFDNILSLPESLVSTDRFGLLKSKYIKHCGINKSNATKFTVDFMLAVTCLEHDCVMISDDHIFKQIKEIEPKLKIESWSE